MPVYASEFQQAIDSVVVKIASWDIIPDINIECVNYETSIDYHICTVKDSCVISKLTNELGLLPVSENNDEDVRCKLIFYSSGEILRSDCVGKRITRIESDYYYTSQRLIDIIDSIVNNPQTKLRKENLDAWDPSENILRLYQYLADRSELLYNNVELEEDLNFTVFCNVGKDGKTINIRFSTCKNGKDKNIPQQILSVIQDILYHEMKWVTPPNYYAQWIPICISIKSNAKRTINKRYRRMHTVSEIQSSSLILMEKDLKHLMPH